MTHRSAHRGLTGWAAVAVAALALTACGVRWETAPLAQPTPDAQTLARDTLAVAEQVVAEAVAADPSSAGSAALRLAQAHLDVLGPVYVAYPSAEPSPAPVPAPPPVDVAIAAARVTAGEVASDPSLGEIARIAVALDLSWALEQTLAAAVDAGTMRSAPEGDQPLPLPDGSPSSAGFSPGADTALSQAEIATLAAAHDQARFVYETVAAWEQGDERSTAMLLASAHQRRSDALATTLAEDPRTPLYQLSATDLGDATARERLAVSVEVDLGARYAALGVQAAAPDRAWLMNCAYDSYARAMALPGFNAGDLPALPGLEVTASINAATPSASGDEG